MIKSPSNPRSRDFYNNNPSQFPYKKITDVVRVKDVSYWYLWQIYMVGVLSSDTSFFPVLKAVCLHLYELIFRLSWFYFILVKKGLWKLCFITNDRLIVFIKHILQKKTKSKIGSCIKNSFYSHLKNTFYPATMQSCCIMYLFPMSFC